MDQSANQDSLSEQKPRVAERPLARNWLWRPWYAKFWWLAILAYWSGMLASRYIPVLADFYGKAFAGYLNILFYPFTALLILGIGYAKAWSAWNDWDVVEVSSSRQSSVRRPGWWIDRVADPLDPRSPYFAKRRHK